MGGGENQCGLSAAVVFVVALVAGTACSLTSKILLSMKSVGITGEEEAFQKPLFQTFGMFAGMCMSLLMQFIYSNLGGPKIGPVELGISRECVVGCDNYSAVAGNDKPVPAKTYFILAMPAVFDLCATALCMFGLEYIDVSIYQMLRGGAIVFVAIFKELFLKTPLKSYEWLGVALNVVAIILVGLTAVMSTSDSTDTSGKSPLVGIALVLAGAFVQSLQYAFEEKVMTTEEWETTVPKGARPNDKLQLMSPTGKEATVIIPNLKEGQTFMARDENDVTAPPLLVIGMEGFWGLLICVLVLYPAVYYLPGSDHGSIEDPFNTYVMLEANPEIQRIFWLYFFSIFIYNMFAVLVTFLLNSVWHAILDNFRPITVWVTDLFIFYAISPEFGEAWTDASYIQLLGLFVLVAGTAIYNGDIEVPGLKYRDEQDALVPKKPQTPSTPMNSGVAFSPLVKRMSHRNEQEAKRQKQLELANLGV